MTKPTVWISNFDHEDTSLRAYHVKPNDHWYQVQVATKL